MRDRDAEWFTISVSRVIASDVMHCPVHRNTIAWYHPDGLRCGICGLFADGRDSPPPEPPTVRSFAFYRSLVKRTDSNGYFPLEYMAGCLCEEAGEFFGRVKKIVYHGHHRDEAALAKTREELGDVLWYLDRCAERIGTTLEQVATENIRKLEKRYPDGFSKEQSRNRAP